MREMTVDDYRKCLTEQERDAVKAWLAAVGHPNDTYYVLETEDGVRLHYYKRNAVGVLYHDHDTCGEVCRVANGAVDITGIAFPWPEDWSENQALTGVPN